MAGESQKKEKLGQILVRSGVITQSELEKALAIQAGSDGSQKIGEILVKQGFCSQEDVALALEKQIGVKYLSLRDYEYTKDLEAILSPSDMNKYIILPIKAYDDKLEVAMADPLDFVKRETLRMVTGRNIIPFLALENQIKEIIFQKVGKKFATDAYIEDAMAAYEEDDANILARSLKADGLEAVNAGPVVRLVTTIITEAVESGASDIHIEPTEKEVVVRYRIDGILHKIMTIPTKIQNPTISRFKILSSLDIAERRKPQDGRMASKIGGKELDFRVSCLPTVFGEKMVLRILDKNNAMVGLHKLGLEDFEERFIRDISESPWGIFLVTGPTGSGKSTTLYSVLNLLNDTKVNIVTIEEPVEYTLNGINQVEVNYKAGLDFHSALKSFLRQDPDIILVGEIRDQETLTAGIEASLTGHLVFSTLHTNDAPSSVVRLVQMGAPNYLVAASCIGIMSQRLMRTVCSVCKEPAPAEDELIALVRKYFPGREVDDSKLFRGRGCTICRNTGFKGRVGIFEQMRVSSAIRELILRDASTDEIRQVAIREGMITLEQSALIKVLKGMTTLTEAIRITTLRKEEAPAYGTDGYLDEFAGAQLDEFKDERLLDQVDPELLDEAL